MVWSQSILATYMQINLLSCVLLGAGGLRVAQLVLICRPPNHWPPICTIAFSASFGEKRRQTGRAIRNKNRYRRPSKTKGKLALLNPIHLIICESTKHKDVTNKTTWTIKLLFTYGFQNTNITFRFKNCFINIKKKR